MDVFYELVDLSLEVFRPGNFEAVLEAMIKRKLLVELEDIALEGRTQLGLHTVGEGRLLFDLLQVREELAEGEIFARVRGKTKGGEKRGLLLLRIAPERGAGLRIANDEDPAQVGIAWFHHQFRQPIHRAERTLGRAERLFAMNHEERRARHGIERLDPAV